MQYRYVKNGVFAFCILTSSTLFALGIIALFKPQVPHAGILIHDMTSSHTFVDDVYFLSVPSLKRRLNNFTNQLYNMTKQPICLSAQFSNFNEGAELNVSVCSQDTKISDLAKRSGNSGVVDIQLGNKKIGEIEWITREKADLALIFGVIAFCLLTSVLAVLTAWLMFYPRSQQANTDEESESKGSSELLRSLYRVMSNNRRVMGLNDNWVCCESATHPNIMIYTLEGSKVRLRASLKDIKKIFPHACFINRRTLINPNVNAHNVNDNKLILESKNFNREYDIDPAYLEGLEL